MELIIVLFYMIVLTAMHMRSVRTARAERDELHRWHSYWEQSRRWLAEFPDAADALEHLKASATGEGGTDISRTREAMRTRRDVPDYTPEERQAAEDFGIVIEPLRKGLVISAHAISAITAKRTPL